MKREFFANASHELKSPLTSIIGYQQMIYEGIIDDEISIMEATQKTIKEASRMNKIIIDMLELSKLESEIEVKKEIVKINQIVQDILNNYQSEIGSKKINIFSNIIDMNLNMNLNHAIELIRNLIDNAIKYNKENGIIRIILNNQLFSIEDTGIGIPLEDQIRVFERFYRVDKGKSKEVGGTGLGLAIVKHICSIYKFELKLESKINLGTKITVFFTMK